MKPENVPFMNSYPFIYRLKLYALFIYWKNDAALYSDLLYRGTL